MPRSMILFLAANPADTRPRALDEECAAIERELRLTAARDDFEFRSKWAVTVDELMRHLLDLQPAIIHFSGHGNARGLLLEGDDGRSQLVAPAALSKMIKSTAASARVAVLNACYSDAQAEALRDVVGCAIGMTGLISEDAARSFSVGFYRALGYRCSVGNAYEQAVATLAAKGLTDAAPRCLVRAGIDLDALKLDGGPPATAVVPPAAAVNSPAVSAARDAAQAAAPASPASSAPATTTASAASPITAPVARYDLFLAHAVADKPSARALYALLQPDVRVFLDERSLPDGARWDIEIPAAQRASRATVFLISSSSDHAWYLGDEIVTAIQLHRAAPAAHLLVPVLLEPGASIPYGLSQVQAIAAVGPGSLARVAAQLRGVVSRSRGQAAPLPLVVPRGSRCDHVQLHDRLSRLTDTVLEQILFYARIDRSLIRPPSARLADRILDVAQLAAVDQELCHHITALLDEKAPWTR
jgi:hypothetical protein